MAKYTTMFVIALLLFVSVWRATRHQPADPTSTAAVQQQQENSFKRADEGCEGLAEEKCLMRRTLVAHTDYIYTQGNKH
ncbi:phytosulfokines-like [Canna indica]|uniref:Phytosulfokine n=1 Tax=Canna indica TaxID=4628 RepID=A0AAQ3KNL9_9LILI|nr:phytosulfokines-like [Canna indica]